MEEWPDTMDDLIGTSNRCRELSQGGGFTTAAGGGPGQVANSGTPSL